MGEVYHVLGLPGEFLTPEEAASLIFLIFLTDILFFGS